LGDVSPSLLPGWTVSHWTTDDGLPSNLVTALSLDGDGLAWVATLDGLARFDGQRFVLHDPGTHPSLPSSRFVDVLVGASGVVWAITEGGGLVRKGGGAFEALDPTLVGLGAARDLVATRAGLFVMGDDGLARLEDGELGPTIRASPDAVGQLRVLYEAPDGSLWVVAWSGSVRRVDLEARELTEVGRLKGDPFFRTGVADPAEGRVLIDGARVWTSFSDALQVVDLGGAAHDLPLREGPARWIWAESGEALLATERGFFRFDSTSSSLVPGPGSSTPGPSTWWTVGTSLFRGTQRVLETSKPAQLLAIGANGSAWISDGVDGLRLVRSGPVRTFQEDPLGQIGVVDSVLVDRAGGVWIGARAGLRRRLDGRTQAVVGPDGSTIIETLALLQNRAGEVLVSTKSFGCRVTSLPDRGTLQCVQPPGHPTEGDDQVMLEGSDGTLWSGSGSLFQRRPGEPRKVVVEPPHWQPFRALLETADKSVLAASIGGGLYRITGDRVELRADEPDSPLRAVRSMLLDDGGDAWLGTEGHGVCRLSLSEGSLLDAPLRCVGRRQGLPDGLVSSLVLDDDGLLWFSSNRGVHAVPWGGLREVLDGTSELVSSISLGRSDGLVEPETNGVRKPSVTQSPDGALWYPTMDGVARLDPSAAQLPSPPSVVVDSLTSPDGGQEPGSEITLRPGGRELHVEWTAAAFTRADAIRFRYRLRGLEPWRGPTDARRASWTTLPPGRYTLELQSGWQDQWGSPQVVADVIVPPTFRETRWFWLFTGLLAWGLGMAMLAGRNRRIRRRAESLQEAVDAATLELAERNARIASQAERLAELDRVRTRFVANISHELRTPLTLIRGTLDDVVTGVGQGVDPRLRVARRNADRLAQLVDQLLDVARLDAGGVALRAARTDLGRWLTRELERFEGAAEARGVSLELDLEPGVIAWIDRDLLNKVLSNLVDNGLDYSPKGGRLVVSLRTRGDEDVGRVQLRVCDGGPGVPEQLRERLFDRFFQADDTDRRSHEGAGIGLSLAQEFVTLHGGSICVEDTEGPGACFLVELPLGAAHLYPEEVHLGPVTDPAFRTAPLPPEEPGGPPTAPDGALPAALVVEDHPDMRAYIATHLGEVFTVHAAEDGQAALDLLEDGLRPAVIVSDVMMPRLDGRGLARALRVDPRFARIPLLLVSAKATEADRVDGLELADDYLTKPFRSVELVLRARNLAARAHQSEGADEEVVDEAPPVSALLLRLVAIAEPHLGDPDFGAARLAKEAGLSPRQLLRRLRAETGLTAARWLRELRLQRGHDLLRNGYAESVGEVAAAVGMSRAYFSRAYHQWSGNPASEDLAGSSTSES